MRHRGRPHKLFIHVHTFPSLVAKLIEVHHKDQMLIEMTSQQVNSKNLSIEAPFSSFSSPVGGYQ